MDAISLLKDDHRTVEQLFKRFEKAGDGAHTEKRQIVDRIVEELSKHAAIEEQVFYPVVRATVPKAEDDTLESLEEHHIVKWVLSELEKMPADAERFDAKVTVLIENVRHHVKEEESDLFPKVRDELGRAALRDLGDALEQAKKTAPTHPHPRQPDTPPGNMIGAAAGVVDRIGDTASGLAQGGVSAVNDIVAMVLRRRKPRTQPTGSRQARATAGRVRSGASNATEAAIEAVEKARDTGRDTVRRVRGGGSTAKKTAKSASRGAKKTARTAKKSSKRTATSARKATKSTARTAKAGAKRTASTASKATKRTASTARKSAPRKSTARKSTAKKSTSRSRRAA